mgnify:CR=1 FL=1
MKKTILQLLYFISPGLIVNMIIAKVCIQIKLICRIICIHVHYCNDFSDNVAVKPLSNLSAMPLRLHSVLKVP